MSSTDDLFVARKLQLGRGCGAPVVVDHVGRLAERGKKSGGGAQVGPRLAPVS
jgi:hypothetical protein